MVQPVYINDIKRWRYNSLNNKLEISANAIPLMDDRIIVKLKTVLNSYRLVEEDDYYYSTGKVVKPFLVTTERQLYPGDTGHVIVENDPVNTIEAALDTSTLGNPEVEAERMIGNYRMGLRRHIVHIGDSPSIEDYADLENSGLSAVPFFPPLPTDFTEPDRISLVTTDGGYKDYVKSANAAVGSPYSALQAKELTGKKTIIWDGGHADFEREADISSISATDSKNLEVEDIETILDAALSGIHANLGDFLPAEKEWGVYNIPGQCVVETTDTKFSIRIYNAAWDTLISEFSIAKATGVVEFGDSTTKATLTPNGNVVIVAGSTTVTLTKNGTFDVS